MEDEKKEGENGGKIDHDEETRVVEQIETKGGKEECKKEIEEEEKVEEEDEEKEKEQEKHAKPSNKAKDDKPTESRAENGPGKTINISPPHR